MKVAVSSLSGIAVVDHLLAERLAQALHGAAIQLAAHDHRIDDAANVVGRDVGDDLDGAGLGIDLDLTYVTAVGPTRPIHLAG